MDAVMQVWERRQQEAHHDAERVGNRRQEIEAQIRATLDRMKLVSSPTAIKYMEADLVALEQQLNNLAEDKPAETEETVDMPTLLTYAKYFAEHLEELLLHHCNPLNRARYFSVLFDQTPSYDILAGGTQKISEIPGLNELFKIAHDENPNMVTPRRVELRLPG